MLLRPHFVHVLTGELTVRVDGSMQVVRGGSTDTPTPMEDVPPGTEVVLGAGDSAHHRFELPAVYANGGSEPVHFVSGGLFAGYLHSAVVDYSIPNGDHVNPVPSLPPGPLTLALSQVTLAPNGLLPASLPDVLRVVAREPGGVGLGTSSNGARRNLGQEALQIYVVTLRPAGAESGTPEATPMA